MAKKSFTNNLGSRKSKTTKKTKLSDADIDSAFGSEQEAMSESNTTQIVSKSSSKIVEEEPETVRLYLRVPKHLHDRLKRVSKELGVTKSALVKQGITAELNRLEN